MKEDPNAKDPTADPTDEEAAEGLSMILDHSLPLTCLLLDYGFNLMPFVGKHAIVVGVFGFLYAMVNLTYEKVAGEGVYPFLMWDTVETGAGSLFTFMGGPLIFFGLLVRKEKKCKKKTGRNIFSKR